MKGSYLLLLQTKRKCIITAGKLGKFQVSPGFYVYCGSAFGPGGLEARIGRHLREEKKLRWHIDYLRAVVENASAYFQENENVECRYAKALMQSGGSIPLKGFGSSDCRCESHLIYFPTRYPIEAFVKDIGMKAYRAKS